MEGLVLQNNVKPKAGDRVGAVKSANKDKVVLFGYGVYRGDQSDNEIGIPKPKIELDNGKIVWGYECWWAVEHRIKDLVSGLTASGAELITEEA